MRLTCLLIISFLLLTGSGCKKRQDNIYLNSVESGTGGNVQFTDTFTINARTVREDSLKTDSLNYNLIGAVNDPIFGRYAATIYTEFRLPQFNKTASGGVDSAVLYLRLPSTTGFYGDLSSGLSLKVYELNEQILKAKSYHSNDQLAVFPTAIGSWSGKASVSDSITIRDQNKNVKIGPSIRIRLSAAFADKLYNASSTDLANQESFLQYLKGLAIIPDDASGTGSILLVDLLIKSKVSLYYSDTLQSDFIVDGLSERINSYKITQQPFAITKQKIAGSYSFDTTYIEALGGAKTKITMPSLLSLATAPIALSKAEIIFKPLAGSYNAPFSLPKRLILVQPDPNTGLNYPILDFLSNVGDYDAINNQYKFNVTRHVQNLLNDKIFRNTDNNLGFYLIIPSDSPLTPSRIVLDTRKGIAGGFALKLYYTKL